MHQTQTFVYPIIVSLPHAQLTPLRTQPLKSIDVTMLSKTPIAIRQTAGSRHGCEGSSKRPAWFARNLRCLYVSACGNQTHTRFRRDRRRGAYEIVRLEKHPPSPCPRLCAGDLFIPVMSAGVSCPEPGYATRHRAGCSGSNCGPTRRNSSQSRELGRKCDLSCRSGAGGGHGSHLLFPRTRCRTMGGNSGRIAGDLRPHSPERVLDSERYGRRAVGTLTTKCSGNDAAPNYRRSLDTAVRHGSPGGYLHDGAGRNRTAAGRWRELPYGGQISGMDAVVGDLVDAPAVSVVVCGAGYHDARARGRHRQCVGRELTDELQRFRLERRGCQTDSY